MRREIVQRGLWDDPFAVDISVLEGIVTLAGQVDHRSMVAGSPSKSSATSTALSACGMS